MSLGNRLQNLTLCTIPRPTSRGKFPAEASARPDEWDKDLPVAVFYVYASEIGVTHKRVLKLSSGGPWSKHTIGTTPYYYY